MKIMSLYLFSNRDRTNGRCFNYAISATFPCKCMPCCRRYKFFFISYSLGAPKIYSRLCPGIVHNKPGTSSVKV